MKNMYFCGRKYVGNKKKTLQMHYDVILQVATAKRLSVTSP